jgi:hypothetical protein
MTAGRPLVRGVNRNKLLGCHRRDRHRNQQQNHKRLCEKPHRQIARCATLAKVSKHPHILNRPVDARESLFLNCQTVPRMVLTNLEGQKIVDSA